MARDRQRAKQRKARRAAQNPGPAPTEPHRSNVPGELEHVSGEADEFDAALVAGARGEPVEGDDDAADDLTARAEADAELEAEGDDAYTGEDGEIYEDELVEDDEPLDDEDDRGAVATRGPDRPATRGARSAGATTARAPGAPTRSGPARLVAFLQASWAELQRVQWPDRRQVFQATAVVLGFVVIAGLYLGIADRVAQELVDLII